jgi:hypothetical protein
MVVANSLEVVLSPEEAVSFFGPQEVRRSPQVRADGIITFNFIDV